jgi:hypothetical protein
MNSNFLFLIFLLAAFAMEGDAQFSNVNILWQQEWNQPSSPALALEKGPNNTWLVASGGFKIHQFDATGNYVGQFFSQNLYTSNGTRWNSFEFDPLTGNYYGAYEAGGYTNRIVTLDSSGNLISNYDVTFGQTGITDVVLSRTGNYYVTGGKNCGGLGGGWDYRTGMLNSGGTMSWNTIDCAICGCSGGFCNYGDEFGYEIIESNDDNVLSGGHRNTGGTGCYGAEGSPYVLKHTPDGNNLWIWDGRISDYYGRISDIVEIPDGNIIFSGYKGNSAGSMKHPNLITLSNQGELLSEWYDSELTNATVIDIIKLPSNELGLVVTNQQDMYFYRWNTASNQTISKHLIPIASQLADIDLSHGEQMRFENGIFTMIYSTGSWFDGAGIGLVQFTIEGITSEINGCTNNQACNFNPSATQDDGTCAFPSQSYLNCDGICNNDSNGNGICDEIESSNTATTTVPAAISYQAVARNAQGQPLSDAAVQVRFTLLTDSLTGAAEYSESHSLTTNSMGLFTTAFGVGTAETGTFAAINWASGSKYLKVELDAGNGFVDMGTQQLLSVPYSMRSNTSAKAGTIENAGLPVYADNAAALAGGLVAGQMYRTATGDLKIVY